MMRTPISEMAAQVVGIVESVSANEIHVLLENESPRSVTLNTGTPTVFPRLNGYVLIPNEVGSVVGSIVWMGSERAYYPKRHDSKDLSLVDLPFPRRKLALCPIGTLSRIDGVWDFSRGIQAFPSVGDSVVIPTKGQLDTIITGTGIDGRVRLGVCPTAYNAKVCVDPDKLFGRHLAVLGNTGSGKSCTVAAIIRASWEAANCNRNEIEAPNARFIILDPNGEYAKCFSDLGKGCRVFHVPHLDPSNDDETIYPRQIRLPAWMWNGSEWAAIAQASPRTQRPILQEALRRLRSSIQTNDSLENQLYQICVNTCFSLEQYRNKNISETKEKQECGGQLDGFLDTLKKYEPKIQKAELKAAIDVAKATIAPHLNKNGDYYRPFSAVVVAESLQSIVGLRDLLASSHPIVLVNEDSPIPFDVTCLPSTLEYIAGQEGGSTANYISPLIMRIRTLFSDERIKATIDPLNVSLEKWLNDVIGENNAETGPISVLDLSLVPYEILHLVIAVCGRLILEAHQRYLKGNDKNLPTVLVLEEAHTFVSKGRSHDEDIPTPQQMCRHTFERIAREGRKFGLGLFLSSQRPSELSETVLSQCNSFILHRMTNDKDQDLVNKLVPDTARGMLRELPSLPTQHCILLGAAAKIPVLLKIDDLQEQYRPRSSDPEFWHVWCGNESRQIDWQGIANRWVGKADHVDSPHSTEAVEINVSVNDPNEEPF